MLRPPVAYTNALETAQAMTSLLKGAQVLNTLPPVEYGTTPKDVVYSFGKMRLLRYRPLAAQTCKTPILVVYALINRYEMMDLQPDRSVIRNLLERGHDIFVIDWGYPDRTDRYKTLDDYVNITIDDCVEQVLELTGQRQLNIVSICQGATLSCMYTSLHQDKIKNLVTLVAPIDFSVRDGLLFHWAQCMDVDRLVDADATVHGDFLNVGFLMLKPLQRMAKHLTLVDSLDDEEKLLNFLRMEKWVFDSPAQAGEAYRQYMKDLFQGNKLIKGEMQLGGQPISLKNITCPLLNIYATQDHIVPPSSTKPLNQHVGSKDKELYEFPGGHIGVFVGSRSQKELAPAISTFLAKRD